MIKVLFLFISLASVAYTHVPSTESCPDLSVQQSFIPADYMGMWYEHSSYPAPFLMGAKCITAEYTTSEDGKIGVQNKMIRAGSESSIEGFATPDADEPGKLKFSFPSHPIRNYDYWVLGTDYTSYSVVWSCRNAKDGGSVRFAWILTRDRHASDEVVKAAKDVFDTKGISKEILKETSQTDC